FEEWGGELIQSVHWEEVAPSPPAPLPGGEGSERHSRGGGNPGWRRLLRTSSHAAGRPTKRARVVVVRVSMTLRGKTCRNTRGWEAEEVDGTNTTPWPPLLRGNRVGQC